VTTHPRPENDQQRRVQAELDPGSRCEGISHEQHHQDRSCCPRPADREHGCDVHGEVEQNADRIAGRRTEHDAQGCHCYGEHHLEASGGDQSLEA